MGKLAIIDTADVIFKNKRTGKVFLTAETQLASISQTLGINEKIWGSIGNKPLFVMKGQKEVTATVRNALYDNEFLSLTQGVDVLTDAEAVVFTREDELVVVDNAGTLEVTLAVEPTEPTVYVRNIDGEVEEATVTTDLVAIPDGHASAGDTVSITYKEAITGEIIEMEADKFGDSFEVEYRTIGYDIDTNEVKVDIIIQLDNVVPNGDFELSFENGTAIAPEFVFDAMVAPNTNKIGRIIEKAR